MGEELDEIYEISSDGHSSWWLTEAEYNRIKKLMSTMQQNSVITFNTLSGGEVNLFLHQIVAISSSTKEQRDFNHERNMVYDAEGRARIEKDGWQND